MSDKTIEPTDQSNSNGNIENAGESRRLSEIQDSEIGDPQFPTKIAYAFLESKKRNRLPAFLKDWGQLIIAAFALCAAFIGNYQTAISIAASSRALREASIRDSISDVKIAIKDSTILSLMEMSWTALNNTSIGTIEMANTMASQLNQSNFSHLQVSILSNYFDITGAATFKTKIWNYGRQPVLVDRINFRYVEVSTLDTTLIKLKYQNSGETFGVKSISWLDHPWEQGVSDNWNQLDPMKYLILVGQVVYENLTTKELRIHNFIFHLRYKEGAYKILLMRDYPVSPSDKLNSSKMYRWR